MAGTLLLSLFLTAAFSLACLVEPWHAGWDQRRQRGADPIAILAGDARRLFANHFYAKADAYFHSGLYPTIFDNRESFQTLHIAADAGATEEKNEGDEGNFLGRERDWIDSFSRKFYPSVHTHLDQGGAAEEDHHEGDGHEHSKEGATHAKEEASQVRELLPWLRLSAELDPHLIETYTVSAYWLRSRLGKARDAELFLREGLRENPKEPAILFELGRIYFEDYKEPDRARNVWEGALVEWERREAGKREPDLFMLRQLLIHLADMEGKENRIARSIDLWQQVARLFPKGEASKRIEELRQKLPKP